MSLLAIIPARGGSKGLPGKNIRPLCGKPLLAYSIEAALRCPLIDRVMVSTESPEIADVAMRHGAEVPFLRPVELAGDKGDLAQVIDDMRWRLANRGYVPQAHVVLLPTSPFRTAGMMNHLCGLLLRGHNTVQTVKPVPQRNLLLQEQGTLQTAHLAPLAEPGAISFRRYGLLGGHNPMGELPHQMFVVRDGVMLIDIDSQDDFELAEAVLREQCFHFDATEAGHV